MTTFQIRFEGLVAPVPKRPPGVTDPPSEVLMVLPDLRMSQKLRVGKLGEAGFEVTPPPHLPCLVVEERFIVEPANGQAGTPKEPSLVYEVRGERFALFLFTQENLSFRLPDVTGFTYFENGLSSTHPPDQLDPDLEHDLRWVPSLALGDFSGAEVFDRSRVLATDAPAEDGDLVGTVTLSRGRFQAAGVRRYLDDEDVERVTLFPFQPVDSPEGSVAFELASAFGSENVIETPHYTIELVWRDSDGGERTLVLGTSVDGQPTLVRIFNRELEAILGVGERTPPDAVDWDTDPAVFYGLSKFRDQFADRPLPVARVEDQAGRGTPGCDARRFESWE